MNVTFTNLKFPLIYFSVDPKYILYSGPYSRRGEHGPWGQIFRTGNFIVPFHDLHCAIHAHDTRFQNFLWDKRW